MDKKYKSIEHMLNKLTFKQTEKPDINTQFYPKVINETDIEFSNEELAMLNKGLKYNLSHKKTHWLKNLAFEAENAITLLATHEQDLIRHQIHHNLKILYKQRIKPQQKNINEYRTINRIKEKLEKGKAMISKADKGKSIIILYVEDYNKKVGTFKAKTTSTKQRMILPRNCNVT
jgi:hypothetical protein